MVQVEIQFHGSVDVREEDAIFNYRRKYLPTQQVQQKCIWEFLIAIAFFRKIIISFSHFICFVTNASMVHHMCLELWCVKFVMPPFIVLVSEVLTFFTGSISHSTSFSSQSNWKYSRRSICFIPSTRSTWFCSDWWMVFS